MRQQLLDLFEIQKIDLTIREQARRQDALPERLHALQVKVRSLTEQLTQLRQQGQQVGAEAQSMRHVVEEEAQKIRKWESRLNDIRNQREYQALLREIESSRRQNRDAEQRIVELYTQKDELDSQVEAVAGQLEEEKTACELETLEVQKAIDDLQTVLSQSRDRRQELIPKVAKQVFRRYDAIRARRQGHGLSTVVQGCCTGCNMRLPPQLYNILQRVDTIEQCPSCHRLVIWDQILAEAGAAAPEAKASAAHVGG